MDLARHGAHGETGVWRVAYSPEWSAAQAQVEEWLAAAGLEVRRDAVGNVWGRLEGTEPGPVIATGSHVDSQTPGGRYDGALGIVAAVAAVRALKEQVGRPRRTLEVVSLCEEEALALPLRAVLGLAGHHGRDAPRAPRRGARRRRRLDRRGDGRRSGSTRSGSAKRGATTSSTFVELHIEQGPRLEDEGYAVGVVNGDHGHPPLRRRARRPLRPRGRAADDRPARPDAGHGGDRAGHDRERARAGPAGGDDDRPHGRRAEPPRGRSRPRQVHGRRAASGRGRAGAAAHPPRGDVRARGRRARARPRDARRARPAAGRRATGDRGDLRGGGRRAGHPAR